MGRKNSGYDNSSSSSLSTTIFFEMSKNDRIDHVFRSCYEMQVTSIRALSTHIAVTSLICIVLNGL